MIRGLLLALGALAAVGASLPAAEADPAPSMAKAANAFLAALDSAKRAGLRSRSPRE